MNSLVESELQRTRWRRTLDRLGVDRIDRDDFGTRAIAARLKTPSILALLLPGDPEGERVDLNSALATQLKVAQVVNLEGTNLSLGGDVVQPTAHALAFTPSYNQSDPWEWYFAVHRSGALELGLGSRGVLERWDGKHEKIRVFQLSTTVAYVWAFMTLAANFAKQNDIAGPWQLTIAAAQTSGAQLGNLAFGWTEPYADFPSGVRYCADSNVLWHIELDRLPEDQAIRNLALGVGSRLEQAWGLSDHRYLARQGPARGQFDLGRF